MVKNVILIFIGFIIYFGKPTLESRTLQKFCDSGEPEVIDRTKFGEGEINVNSISMARSWLVHLSEEDNSGIELNLKSFVLEDFFLVIQDGMGSDGSYGSNDAMIQIISGQSDEALLFTIPLAKSFYMEICPEYAPVSELLHGNFRLSFKRRAFQENLPEEKPDIQIEKESYEVQFKGQPPEKYTDPQFVHNLKEVIKNLARDYCSGSDIKFDEEKPADEMVTILAIRYCPDGWHERQLCASIKHSVYVTQEHKMSRAVLHYELRRKHLKEMWKNVNDSYFKELQLSIYKFPNKEELLGEWFLLIVLPSVILIFTTISILKICSYIKGDKQTEPLKDSKSMTTASRRKSKLKPNKYQYVPSFITDQTKTSHSHKQQNLDNINGQYDSGTSYFASLIFTKLPRSYSGRDNNASQ